MADDKPIIIIKKKGGHGGHHGGAWKVAYADFVTAMMAFFMVMWLVNTAETTVKQAIASYFRKPGIFDSGSGTPLMIGESGILSDGYVPPHPEDTKQMYPGKSKELLKEKSGNDSNSTGNKRVTYHGEEGKRDSVPDQDASQRGYLSEETDNPEDAHDFSFKDEAKAVIEAQKGEMAKAAEELKEEILSAPELKEMLGLVDVKLDADGLNIEIMDTEKTSMFQSGSAQISPQAEEAFNSIAPIIAKLPNKIDIAGHTDNKPFSKRPGGYSNWELSADRANAARRLLEKAGVPPERVASVAGRASQELKIPSDPLAASNRRITLKVRFDLSKVGTDKKATFPGSAIGLPVAPRVEPKPDAKVEKAPTPAAKKEPVDFSPEVIRKELEKKKGGVKIPDAPVPTENPLPGGKDKIFGDTPVIGPADPFTNLQ